MDWQSRRAKAAVTMTSSLTVNAAAAAACLAVNHSTVQLTAAAAAMKSSATMLANESNAIVMKIFIHHKW